MSLIEKFNELSFERRATKERPRPSPIELEDEVTTAPSDRLSEDSEEVI
jgi:hypothetical protein